MTRPPLRRPSQPRRAVVEPEAPAGDAAAAARRIAAGGCRPTRARIDVLATLLTAEQALTHHDVEARLGRGGGIDRVTLYRVLDWLVEQGYAHRLAGEDRVWRFSASPAGADHAGQRSGHAHAHFHCVGCGKVVCLLDARMPVVSVPVGYRRRDVEVTVKGYCDHCSR